MLSFQFLYSEVTTIHNLSKCLHANARLSLGWMLFHGILCLRNYVIRLQIQSCELQNLMWAQKNSVAFSIWFLSLCSIKVHFVSAPFISVLPFVHFCFIFFFYLIKICNSHIICLEFIGWGRGQFRHRLCCYGSKHGNSTIF